MEEAPDTILAYYKAILIFMEGKNMYQSRYEAPVQSSPLGIRILYQTLPGGFNPLHWHETLELLFPLNGNMNLLLEGERYNLPKNHLAAIESRQAHGTQINGDTAMNICVHISKSKLKNYLPEIEQYQITCIPEKISPEQLPVYSELCQTMSQLPKLYILDAPEVQLESEGIILQVLARLLHHFGTRSDKVQLKSNQSSIDRIYEILPWVEAHYNEPITLTDAADQLSISKEYFCRLFRQNMGITFQEYLTDIRLNHVYQDLFHTDVSISEVMETNGFTNQKNFNASFKKLYGRTPSEVRKLGMLKQGQSAGK